MTVEIGPKIVKLANDFFLTNHVYVIGQNEIQVKI